VSRILFLTVADDPATWASLGFTLDGATVRLGTTAITLTGASPDAKGITGWLLADDSALPASVDGLPTSTTTGAPTPPTAPSHANGITAIDHLVVMTPNIDRTVSTFEDLGWECRRRREGAAYGQQQMRQAFFWLGDVIVEVVGPDDVDPAKSDVAASFFGLALTAADLSATQSFFGDLMKPPVEAVQPGRQITTISSRGGSTVAIAVMSPHRSEASDD
jgi:hypothetical protein